MSDLPAGPVLYVAIANDFPFFKVGSTRKLKVRAASLKWIMPGGMRLLAFWKWKGRRPSQWWRSQRQTLRSREMDLHARLDSWCVGGEWFQATPESLALIKSWGSRLPEPTRAVLPESPKRRRRALAQYYATLRGAA